MTSTSRPARVFLTTMIMVVFMAGMSWGATLSGSITNATGKSGRLYVMLIDQNSGQASGYGTSVANVAANAVNVPYTIKGVRQGTFSQVRAFLDTRNTGFPYAASPIGSTNPATPINVSTSDIPGLNFTIQDQAAQTPVAPINLKAAPMNGGALILWDIPKNTADIEIADTYNVYWSTSANPGPGQIAGGGSLTGISSRDDGHVFIPLTNGVSYYFAAEAVLGASTAISRTVTPTTIGSPAGGNTVTVHINFTSTPPVAPLLAVLIGNQGPGGGALITSPVQNQTINIAGVPDGSYELYVILDKNNNKRFDTGDVNYSDNEWVTPRVTVQGAPVDMAPLSMSVTRNLEASVMTDIHTNSPTPYQLNFEFNGQIKRPAHIVINSGQQVTETSIGQNSWGSFSLEVPLAVTPKVGDSYNLTVTYTDNTAESIILTVNNVMNKSPNQTYPIGVTAPSSTNPRFAWNTVSGGPNSAFMYHLALMEANTSGDYLWEKYLTPDQVSVQYEGPALTTGRTYNWGINMYDKYGNRTTNWQQFTPQASGPSISSLSTTTLPCGSGTPITINGSGFSSTPANNAVYFNNTFVAVTPTAASSSQLTVNLPACSNAPSTGPIIVATNGQTVASAVEFTPTFTYNYYVTDFSNIVMSGVQVEVADKPSVPAVLSNASGFFSLAGIPTGVIYRLKLSKLGYMPVYTAFFLNYSNVPTPVDSSYNFALAQQSHFTSWGIQPGKGVLRARTRDGSIASSTNYLGGVTVSAYSNNHDSYNYYTVAYTNPANTTQLISGTSTYTDGKYYVLNVEEGDVITVTASKTGYNFPNARIFIGKADAMGQSSIYGVPAVSISGFSPSSAIPGGSITITGSNFNTNAASNQVCFGTQCTTPNSATSTQLVVTVPCGAQNGPISVSTNNQTAFSSTSFTVPAPTITSIFPTQGPLNANVVINGTNFSNCQSNQVSFNYQNSFNVSWFSSSQISAYVPFGATTGLVRVTTEGGTATGPTYTVLPNPSISSSSPESGPAGTVVTVTGSFYEMNPAMYQILVDGITATVNSVTANTLTFTIPGGTTNSMTQYYIGYFGIQYWNATFTVTPKLTVTITGAGNVNVTSLPTGTVCVGTWCRIFDFNTSVTLTASPSAGYDYGVWGGNCAGTASTPCTLAMDANKAVTATFPIQDNARLNNDPTPYGTVLSAYNAATVNGTVIKLRDKAFSESLNADNGTVVTLSGGYAADFGTSHTGITSITSLIISLGSLTIDNLTIK
ncbi:MAG: IPT/TIG domain-containing protein [Geobacteraceae bacterium]|nr:IPT/TIG domain-containing protein [Geobacteraceae bacterium]